MGDYGIDSNPFSLPATRDCRVASLLAMTKWGLLAMTIWGLLAMTIFHPHLNPV